MRPEQKRTEESIPISKYGIVLWSWFTGIDPQAGGDTAVREGFSFFLANSHNRGESGAAAGTVSTGGGSSSTAATTVAASASETPSRCARAVRERAGASPRARSAANNAGKRT